MRELIAHKLRELRIAANLTADEVGAMVGKSGKTVNAWENNRGQPDAGMLIKLCDIYNVDDILSEFKGVAKKEFSDNEKQLIKKYNSLDEISKAAVNNCIDFEYGQTQKRKNTIQYINPTPLHIYTAPKYAATVSAGTGNYIMSDFADNIELTSPPPKGTNYIVTVSGDSMEPTYFDGDMLYIKSCPDIETGQIGIYVIDGSSYVKEKGINRLISHNKNYGDIQSGSSAQCLGLVLGKVDEKDIYKAGGI